MLDISDIYFHDAYFVGIEITTLKDHFDYVAFKLEYDEFREQFGTDKIKLIFDECFMAKMFLPMWFHGKGYLMDVYYKKESDMLDEINDLKNKKCLPKDIEFKHYCLECNSGSVIDILAKGFRVESVKV